MQAQERTNTKSQADKSGLSTHGVNSLLRMLRKPMTLRQMAHEAKVSGMDVEESDLRATILGLVKSQKVVKQQSRVAGRVIEKYSANMIKAPSKAVRKERKAKRSYSTRTRQSVVEAALNAIGSGDRHKVFHHISSNGMEKTSLASVTRHLKKLAAQKVIKVKDLGGRKYEYFAKGAASSKKANGTEAPYSNEIKDIAPTEVAGETPDTFFHAMKLEVHRLGCQIDTYAERLAGMFKLNGVSSPTEFVAKFSEMAGKLKNIKKLAEQPLSDRAVGYLFSCVNSRRIDIDKLLEAQNG